MTDWGYGFDEPIDTPEVTTVTCDRCGCECEDYDANYVLGRIKCDDCWEDCGEQGHER